MATYCISDIHGHYNEFMRLLDKVSPRESDKIYVLGDIIDKGYGSAQMLKWAVDKANSNVKFLLGNHEDMSAATIVFDPVELKLRKDSIWVYNGGDLTVRHLLENTDADWRENRLVPWLRSLPLYEIIEVKGEKRMLVHAGFECAAFDKNVDFDFLCGRCDEIYSRQEDINLKKYGFGVQYSQDMLWIRNSWIMYKKFVPIMTIYGHSFVGEEGIKLLKENGYPIEGGNGRFLHVFNRVGIDCGCAHDINLGMLRLDDMEEFYLKEK